ncbi:hypothetical protein IV102_37535 [bacterium]|nr:hypothetical protein [bacterium]
MINVHKGATASAAVTKKKVRQETPTGDCFSRSQGAEPAPYVSVRQMQKATVSEAEFAKPGYTARELSIEFSRLSSNPQGRFGALDSTAEAPLYFQTVLDSLKPGETLAGPVNVMLDLVNRFMFSQDQVVPAYQAIDQFAANPDDRLKLADRFMNTLSDVQKHSPAPGMAYDSRPMKAVKQFSQEMSHGHQPAGYSAAELKRESSRLGANPQSRYGALGDEMQAQYFGTVVDSLKPGEPLAGAVDSMLRIVNGMMFSQDQVVPVYTLIDKYAATPDERLKLTEKFFDTLADVQAKTPAPGMHYDSRPSLAQKQFEKELKALNMHLK